MTSQEYLDQYYFSGEKFAAHCAISFDLLGEMISQKLVPEPSYVVRGQSIRSFVFGESFVDHLIDGDYFHPALQTWVQRAHQTLQSVGTIGARQRLQQAFYEEFTQALVQQHSEHYQLHDCFDAQGVAISQGLQSRCETAWTYFLNGTFGLCVANPSRLEHIARKEVLQEQLNVLSENGNKRIYSSTEKETLLPIMQEYARACMPFAPHEFGRSSRKRLLDDLYLHLEKDV